MRHSERSSSRPTSSILSFARNVSFPEYWSYGFYGKTGQTVEIWSVQPKNSYWSKASLKGSEFLPTDTSLGYCPSTTNLGLRVPSQIGKKLRLVRTPPIPAKWLASVTFLSSDNEVYVYIGCRMGQPAGDACGRVETSSNCHALGESRRKAR